MTPEDHILLVEDDDIDAMIGVDPFNLLSQFLSHSKARFVNADTIHDGVGPSKVYVFEDTRCGCGVLHAHADVTIACLHVNEEGFTGLNVALTSK